MTTGKSDGAIETFRYSIGRIEWSAPGQNWISRIEGSDHLHSNPGNYTRWSLHLSYSTWRCEQDIEIRTIKITSITLDYFTKRDCYATTHHGSIIFGTDDELQQEKSAFRTQGLSGQPNTFLVRGVERPSIRLDATDGDWELFIDTSIHRFPKQPGPTTYKESTFLLGWDAGTSVKRVKASHSAKEWKICQDIRNQQNNVTGNRLLQ